MGEIYGLLCAFLSAMCSGFSIGVWFAWRDIMTMRERFQVIEVLCEHIAKRQDEIEKVLKSKKED